MRVMITGAGGFVGKHLIRHLLDSLSGIEIVGTSHPVLPSEDFPDPRVRFVPCDIAVDSGADLRRLVREVRPDRLYHLAGAASGASIDRAAVFEVNVEGTRHVVDAAHGVVAPEHVLFASTGYVYGRCDPSRPARENDPLPSAEQFGLYAASKRAAEDLILTCRGAVIARAFNHTGPGQTAAFSVPAFASQIVQVERGRQPEVRVGNLEAQRDFLDVRDVVRAYHQIMEIGSAGEIYNVCSGQARRMSDVLDELRAYAVVPVPLSSDSSRMRPSDIPVSIGSHGKLTTMTGWLPQISFSQTLRETLDWWRGRQARQSDRCV